MAADDLAMQGARASATMVMTYLTGITLSLYVNLYRAGTELSRFN